MKARGCGCLGAGAAFLVGLALTAVGIGLLNSAIDKRNNYITVTGVVIDLVENRDSDGVTYAPVIEYEDPTGDVHVFRSGLSRSPAPSIGDPIGVLINPDDYGDATERSAWLQFVFPGMALGFGLIIMLVTTIVFVKARQNGTRDTSSGSSSTIETVFSPPSHRTMAEYRGTEPRGPDENGRFEFRVVALTEDGTEVYSEWLEEDPSTAMILAGVDDVAVEWRDGVGRVVDFPTS